MNMIFLESKSLGETRKAGEEQGGEGTQYPFEGFTLPLSDRKLGSLSSSVVLRDAFEGFLTSIKNVTSSYV